MWSSVVHTRQETILESPIISKDTKNNSNISETLLTSSLQRTHPVDLQVQSNLVITCLCDTSSTVSDIL